MSNGIKKGLLLVLILLFSVSCSGLLFFMHICHSSQKNELSLVIPSYHPGRSCSCYYQGSTGSSASDARISGSVCCENHSIFFKIPVYQEQTSGPIPLFNWIQHGITSLSSLYDDQETDIRYFFRKDHAPPPLLASYIVFHQLRIPEPGINA